MTQRVKWISTIKDSDAKAYKAEIAKVVKKDLIEKGVEAKKARYIVVEGKKQIVSTEIIGKPSEIKETVIVEDSPYAEQSPAVFKEVLFDCLESELQDYGTVKYYRSEIYGKIKVSKNAIYYLVGSE